MTRHTLVGVAMHRLGLHGKSFLPLFLGFGCNVPAVLGTRMLDSKRDRLLTSLLVPLVPCAGRMAVLVFVTNALFGSRRPLVILGLLALDLAVVALSGLLFHRLLLPGESPAFIMELPLYHLPNWRTIGLHTWQHLVEFVRRAGSVILLLSLAVWALAALPTGIIEQSYLAGIGRLLAGVLPQVLSPAAGLAFLVMKPGCRSSARSKGRAPERG